MMEWMVFDDLLNIGAIVMLMGLGIGAFLLIMFVYITVLRALEIWHD